MSLNPMPAAIEHKPNAQKEALIRETLPRPDNPWLGFLRVWKTLYDPLFPQV
jgi:hypothetical protein